MNKKDEKPPTEETPEEEGPQTLSGPHMEIQFENKEDLKSFFIKYSPDFPPHILLVFHGEGQAHFNMRSAGATPWMKAVAGIHLGLIAEMEISRNLMAQFKNLQKGGILKPGFDLPPNFDARGGQ